MGPVRRAWLCWRAWQVTLGLSSWVLLALFWMGLHGANAYPRELAKAEAVLRDAQRTWFDICKEGREVVPKRIPCDKSREEVGLDPRRLALERSLHIVLSDTLHTVNPFYWIGCGTGSQCYYVLLKCVDAVFSSLFVGVGVVAAARWLSPIPNVTFAGKSSIPTAQATSSRQTRMTSSGSPRSSASATTSSSSTLALCRMPLRTMARCLGFSRCDSRVLES